MLGGIGNIKGAMLGGLLLGVIESLAVTFMDPAFKDVIAFLVLILVLTFRPEGLLGESLPTGGRSERGSPAASASRSPPWAPSPCSRRCFRPTSTSWA